MSNKIYDCITFFDEPLQASLRFNILNNCVEKFIVCESKFDHKGQYKGINFNIENYSPFKIILITRVISITFTTPSPFISLPLIASATLNHSSHDFGGSWLNLFKMSVL